MKKVININFQGRVIPIEETAYEMLQQYIGSLRNYFANEEGRDEIINDIENRIAELFGETLKKGAACITDADVSKVMDSMGRPEDFGEPEMGSQQQGNTYQQGQAFGGTTADAGQAEGTAGTGKKRLYRDEQDKILGGVASGLANYLNLDPAVIRIIFALLAIFGGSGFLIYIILWIVLPSRSLVTNIRKRLYRDADDRVIAGVCGGLAKYFDINPAIPRVIFAAPFIFGIITSIGRHFFDPGSVFVGGFGGGTFILVYVILWIVLPEALTAAEKLEMRGEKVDLNSIRNTVMSDMQGFKGRAQKMGEEISESAQRIGGEIKESFQAGAQNVGSDIRQASRRGSGLGNALAILVKAFVYFVGGAIAFGLLVGFIALMGAGVGVMPLKDFLLQGSTQNAMAWGSLLLFLGIPVIALVVWFIRRLMGVRQSNKFIGFGFTAAWLVGLFCFIGLLGSLNRSFSAQVGLKEDRELVQPANGKMELRIAPSNLAYYNGWMELDGLLSVDQDTLFLNTARVDVVRSKDSLFRVHIMKISKGRNREQAQRLAEKISFPIEQKDSILYLPETFTVSKHDKWRNQRVLMVIEVPLGKELKIDQRIGSYEYFSIELGNHRNWNYRMDYDLERSEYWDYDRDMKMTEDGLKWDGDDYRDSNRGRNGFRSDEQESVNDAAPDSAGRGQQPQKSGADKKQQPAQQDSVYRYQQTKVSDKVQVIAAGQKKQDAQGAHRRADSPLASITRIF